MQTKSCPLLCSLGAFCICTHNLCNYCKLWHIKPRYVNQRQSNYPYQGQWSLMRNGAHLHTHLVPIWFWFWEWTPSIGRKVGIPRGILPHVQTGLTNWNPDNSLSLPGFTNWNPDNCLGKQGIPSVLF